MYDLCIIGGGIVGTNIARELSKYQLNILVLEKEEDIGCGATKANSGIVHGGYVAKPDTLKGKLCIQGNRMYRQLNQQLNFGYKQTGALVLAFNQEDMEELEKLYQSGIENGVKEIEIIDREQALQMEPNLNPDIAAALYCGEVGITSPYEFAIALMENAIDNGVTLKLNTEVKNIEKDNGIFTIDTGEKSYQARYIINSAGVFSDKIASMVGQNTFDILPRRGQYVIFDKGTGEKVNHVIFQVPSKKGKGILVASTYHGNLMIGPNAEDTQNKEDVGTEKDALEEIVMTAKRSVPQFNLNQIIRTFSGIRATPTTKDFIIEETKEKGFINVAGIESPGLTASPAIALHVKDILKDMGVELVLKEDFNPYRKPIIKEKNLKPEEIKDLLFIDSAPEKIICRCEGVSEAEIVDALHRNIDIYSPDAIKRRTRAGMGRCQGGFCESRVREIISREKNIPLDQVPHREDQLKGKGEREKADFYRK
ncbi:FAD-dependent oxidoreductase [Irregularibacter muris]|uniref:FAD-dependent oxidoreductase n=1 Tax=Irregularibacter muris TaxID=1796619 RepID=A0AAE3KYK1_9FIRM|nr:NAD(P)/FAD-dependent oxidoreductase [Irregularibacter muris]MCR1897570.1 FAD-dependent oxidoreductase [Irregularibacter muris]